MEKPRKKKGKKGGKRKGSKKGKRRGKRADLATQLINAKAKIASIESRYADKHRLLQDRILKAAGSEKERLRKLLGKLEAERGKELARKDKQIAVLRAAEGKKRRSGKRKGKRRGARRNPIGSGGAHEWGATALGVFAGLVLTIGPYRMIRSHALIPQGAASTGADQPNQGDVPNLLTGSLPLWSRLKWRGLIAILTVGTVDIALPAVLAAWSDSDFWKTFNQTWMLTGVALTGAKLTTDVAALAMKKTLIGQRMFAPENTARDVRVQSAAAALPAIMVQPGLGLPGLTGYGKPQAGCAHVGAGAPCCSACAGATGKTASPNGPPGVGTPISGTTPVPAAPGVPGQVEPQVPNMGNTGSPSLVAPGGSRGTINTGAAGADVTPINKFAPKNRFDGPSRFGTR